MTTKIKEIRKNETNIILKNAMFRSIIDTVINTTPLLISITIFSVYVAINEDLKPSKTYAVLAYFNLLLIPLRMIVFAFL